MNVLRTCDQLKKFRIDHLALMIDVNWKWLILLNVEQESMKESPCGWSLKRQVDRTIAKDRMDCLKPVHDWEATIIIIEQAGKVWSARERIEKLNIGGGACAFRPKYVWNGNWLESYIRLKLKAKWVNANERRKTLIRIIITITIIVRWMTKILIRFEKIVKAEAGRWRKWREGRKKGQIGRCRIEERR